MLRNYFLINLLLIVIIVFLGLKFNESYKHNLLIPNEPSVNKDSKDTAAEKTPEKPLDSSSFQIISLMDLFRPSRTPFKEEQEQKAAPPPVPPRLFGTIIFNDEKSAILEDPNTKSTRMYKVNETVAGYVVADILEDRVVLSWNGEKSDIKLRDEKKGLPPPRPMVMPQQQAQPSGQQQPQIQPGGQVQPQRPVPQRPPVVPAPRPVPERQLRPNPSLPTRR